MPLKSLVPVCLLAASLLGTTAVAGSTDPASECPGRVAEWLDPADGKTLAPGDLFERLSSQSVVLLGEVHDNADHHRWQLGVLAALHSRNANVVVGLEMLPRKAQGALDAWTRGALDEAAFLEQSGWRENWGYDPGLYLPILHFARLHRLPAVAINIDRQLVAKVGEAGWDALAEEQRMGLSEPAPANPGYRRGLAELYRYKLGLGLHGGTADEGDQQQDVEQIMQSEAFNHFVDAQLTWDRAMAEALATARRADPAALVVAIVGRGHLEYGYGIPHQLADLGIDDVAVLLPIDATSECGDLDSGLADAVFVVAASGQAAPARPRLGVMIENAESGVRVTEVVAGSVAASSGLREGDIILRAAGFATATTGELVEVIRRQAPGTWLPLDILRDGREAQVTARFPQSFE